MAKVSYTVVIERAPGNFSAYVPDLPGCVAVAKTRRALKRLIREAIPLHVEDMRNRGYFIRKPTATSELIKLQST